MGWQIAELKNTVKISKAAEKEITEWAQKTIDIDDVVYNGKLYFNPDYMEHMDFLWQEGFDEIAEKFKLNGEVCFGSLDGDNAGEFWGYRFTKGKMTFLTGEISWVEDKLGGG